MRAPPPAWQRWLLRGVPLLRLAVTMTKRPRDRARPDEHGERACGTISVTRQVRPGNEGPRARCPRPDALLTIEGLALSEERIRTGDEPGRGTDSHLPPPPPDV